MGIREKRIAGIQKFYIKNQLNDYLEWDCSFRVDTDHSWSTFIIDDFFSQGLAIEYVMLTMNEKQLKLAHCKLGIFELLSFVKEEVIPYEEIERVKVQQVKRTWSYSKLWSFELVLKNQPKIILTDYITLEPINLMQLKNRLKEKIANYSEIY